MAGQSPSFKEVKEEETQTTKYNSVIHSPFIQGKTGKEWEGLFGHQITKRRN